MFHLSVGIGLCRFPSCFLVPFGVGDFIFQGAIQRHVIGRTAAVAIESCKFILREVGFRLLLVVSGFGLGPAGRSIQRLFQSMHVSFNISIYFLTVQHIDCLFQVVGILVTIARKRSLQIVNQTPIAAHIGMFQKQKTDPAFTGFLLGLSTFGRGQLIVTFGMRSNVGIIKSHSILHSKNIT